MSPSPPSPESRSETGPEIGSESDKDSGPESADSRDDARAQKTESLTERLQSWWRDIKRCTVFLTRLPIKVDADDRRDPISAAMRAFPIVGAGVGAAGGVVFVLAVTIGLIPAVAGALALGAMMLVTGAFHEDAIADVADGFGGGQTVERKIEIMRDSRLGTYGAAALIVVLGAKIGLLAQAGAAPGGAAGVLGLLIASGAVSRAVLVSVAHHLPMAAPEGQAAAAGPPSKEQVLQAGLAAAICALLALNFWAFALGAAAATAAGYALARVALHQIGGQTGDVLGACQQVAELAFLAFAVAVLSA